MPTNNVNEEEEKINMKIDQTEIEINGVKYVQKGSENKQAETLDGLEYKIVRTYSAGVFAGYLKEKVTKEGTTTCVLLNARRLWSWAGAASLSEMAMHGTSKPEGCKFPCEVSKVELLQVIEILDVTKKAKESIDSVKVWTART